MNAEFLSNNKPVYLICRAMDHSPMQSEVAHFGVISMCHAGKIFLNV